MLRQMRGNPLYESADLHQKGVTHRVDITQVPLPDASYDVVIAHHVLEHIPDDRQAMREMFRLLKPGGVAVLSVPLNATRQQTYENAAITAPEQRHAHFSARTIGAITGWTSRIASRRLVSDRRPSACRPRRKCATACNATSGSPSRQSQRDRSVGRCGGSAC